MYTYSIVILKIARKINRNVEFPGFSRSFIRLSVNPHWKLRFISYMDLPVYSVPTGEYQPAEKKTRRVMQTPTGHKKLTLLLFRSDILLVKSADKSPGPSRQTIPGPYLPWLHLLPSCWD